MPITTKVNPKPKEKKNLVSKLEKNVSIKSVKTPIGKVNNQMQPFKDCDHEHEKDKKRENEC
jgi:hypothetical protein